MSEEERAQYEQSVQMLRAQGWTMVLWGTSLRWFLSERSCSLSPPGFHNEMTFRQALIVRGMQRWSFRWNGLFVR